MCTYKFNSVVCRLREQSICKSETFLLERMLLSVARTPRGNLISPSISITVTPTTVMNSDQVPKLFSHIFKKRLLLFGHQISSRGLTIWLIDGQLGLKLFNGPSLRKYSLECQNTTLYYSSTANKIIVYVFILWCDCSGCIQRELSQR